MMRIQKSELFDIWRIENITSNKNHAVFNYVSQKFNLGECKKNATYLKYQKIVRNFTSKLKEKWKKSSRSLSIFKAQNNEWLNEYIIFSINCKPVQCLKKKGRPSKSFVEATVQTRRKKLEPIINKYTKEELVFAASKSLHKSGRRDAAGIVEKVIDLSPKRTSKIKHAISSSLPITPPLIKYTPEEGLALFIDSHLTKHSYMLIKSGSKVRNADIYPAYNEIQKAKKACYPAEEYLVIEEHFAEVKLQALVDHTCRRLVSVQESVLRQKEDVLSKGLTMVYKWGCDGSAGHSMYKQKFISECSTEQSDAFLFAVCLVPLRLQSYDNQILWNNPRPSSTRFCRPIKLLYEKESTELSKKEIRNVENQIKEIFPTEILINNQKIQIYHTFKLTMIDGKMFGVITQSSTQTCGICGATPRIMNNIDLVSNRLPNKENFNFGISVLHAWIRCFETLLHICYKLTIKKWQARDETEKLEVARRKKIIREQLKTQMGLLVDIPKPGFGTTNDGNTARRFFRQPSLASIITGIDENLIDRFSVILKTMSCGYAINEAAFREYTRETAEKFVELYSWYYMPSSIHRILIHGADIIKTAGLPIGMLSEEALESRNKDFKKYREFHTRKISRTRTMQDLMNYLFFSSDPKISLLSKSTSTMHKKGESLNEKVVMLLSEPVSLSQNLPTYNNCDDDSTSISSPDTE